MTIALVFDAVPTEPVAAGASFTVAVLVQKPGSGEPDTEWQGQVKLELSAGDGQLGGTVEVDASFGEALFDDLTYSGSEPFALVAVCGSASSDPSDPIDVEGGGGGDGGATAADDEDELLADVPLLVQRLTDASTSAVKQKHFAYLLKSRLWNHEQNRARLLEMKAATRLLGLVERCVDDEDMLLKLLPVLHDLFTFSGAIRYTCSNSHGTIKEFPFVRTHHDGATKNWIPACFQCAATKEPIFDKWPPEHDSKLSYQIHNHLPYKMGSGPDGSVVAEAEAFHPRVVEDPAAGDPFREEACAGCGAELLLKLLRGSLQDEYLCDKVVQALVPLLTFRPADIASVAHAASAAAPGAETAAGRVLSVLPASALRVAPDQPAVRALLSAAADNGALPRHLRDRAASLLTELDAAPPGRSPLVARLPQVPTKRPGLRALCECGGGGAVLAALLCAE